MPTASQRSRAAGATAIADDVGYFDEPFYQDGIVAQSIDTVEATGVAYFSAAGNDGDASYENTAPIFATLSNTGRTAGEFLLNFDSAATPTQIYNALRDSALAMGGSAPNYNSGYGFNPGRRPACADATCCTDAVAGGHVD